MKKLHQPLLWMLLAFVAALASCSMDMSRNEMATPGTGQGGSMARFTISGSTLYIVDNNSLIIYDIGQPGQMQHMGKLPLGFGIETIFPYQDKLYIGSQNAMYIVDISRPHQPTVIGQYSHLTACDPVVVRGDYAYVTLRDDASCRRSPNVLEVIDISNPAAPRLVNSIDMLNPHGLGVIGNDLFVCEGKFGLKRFDLSRSPVNPLETVFLRGIDSYDVIPLPQSLLMIGADGLFQYDYSQPARLELLSKIPVKRP